MFNQRSGDVIVHMTMERAKVRFNGQDHEVLIPADTGFCTVEFDDGEGHRISHPLQEWIMDAHNRSGAVGTVFFKITAAGQRPNPETGVTDLDVNNIIAGIN